MSLTFLRDTTTVLAYFVFNVVSGTAVGQNVGCIEVKVVVFNLKIMGLSKHGVSTAFPNHEPGV